MNRTGSFKGGITIKYRSTILSAMVASVAFLSESAWAIPSPVLGSSEDYAVLGSTGVSNTGSTVVSGSATILGNVGDYQAIGADAISGFSIAGNTFYGPGTFTDGPGPVTAPAAIHGGDGPGSGTALNARNDLITAYNALALLAPTGNLTGAVLGSGGTVPTLTPGVYSFSSSAQLTGALTLNAQGKNGVYWVFVIGSTLTTASASSVVLINPGSNKGSDDGVFWVVGSAATLGTTTAFEGNILADQSITLNTGASIENGRALAINAAVSLDDNAISDICLDSNGNYIGPGLSSGLGFDTNGKLVNINGQPVPVIPEPCTLLLVGSGLVGLVASRARRSRRSLP